MVLQRVNTFFKIFLIIFVLCGTRQATLATQKVESLLLFMALYIPRGTTQATLATQKSRISTFILGVIKL